MRQEVINHLSPCCTGVESVAFPAFDSSRPVASQIRGIYNVDLFSDITLCVTDDVIEIEQICAPVCSTAIPSCLIEQLSHVPLVTSPIDNLTIDLLVGLDYHWSIVLPAAMSLGQGLVAQETLIGWLLSGCTGGTPGDGQG